jgi:maltose alpha-D-glucosyltransferase/alpha-amylase
MINDLWYKNAVIYCLSVGTYMDANGDGIGDFQGLMRRLDYLHGLGVTALWLMPFQTSPHRDDGYDVSDYYSVDRRYGTLGDFVEFTHGAKQRGIRVLIDLESMEMLGIMPPPASHPPQGPCPDTSA